MQFNTAGDINFSIWIKIYLLLSSNLFLVWFIIYGAFFNCLCLFDNKQDREPYYIPKINCYCNIKKNNGNYVVFANRPVVIGSLTLHSWYSLKMVLLSEIVFPQNELTQQCNWTFRLLIYSFFKIKFFDKQMGQFFWLYKKLFRNQWLDWRDNSGCVLTFSGIKYRHNLLRVKRILTKLRRNVALTDLQESLHQ